jgi:hypothetical protein
VADGDAKHLKAWSSLPIRFSLGGDQGLGVLAGTPQFQRTDCTTSATIGSPVAASASEPFSYDARSQTYKFVWKTQKPWAGWCGTLTVALADGTWHDVAVVFKR